MTAPEGGFTLFLTGMDLHQTWWCLRRLPACVALAAALCAPAAAATGRQQAAATTASPDAVLYRLYLDDGTTLVSYGEFATVGDGVVLSVPVGGTEASPVLHLVSIPQSRVNWDRTNAYAHAARARRYADTRGEADFARVTREVADTLYMAGSSDDPAARVELAEKARRQLVAWSQDHYGYRAGEIAQMTTWLDQVVSELRVAAGQSRFDLALVASPAVSESPGLDLLPAPSFQERVELALAAAHATGDPQARISLLRSILDVLAPSARPEFSGTWMESVRTRAAAELSRELAVEKTYARLRGTALARAAFFEKRGDVRGLQGVIRWVLDQDQRLARGRPAEVTALLAALDAKLDAARRFRLAADAWVLRRDAINRYWATVRQGLDTFLGVREWLRDVRHLAGPSPGALRRLARAAAAAQQELSAVTPPVEVAAAHGTLVTAASMAVRAATSRHDALRSGSMETAWQASSAAAGSLLLLDQAIGELRRITHAPAPPR